jgi:hypothetical protein
MFAEPAEVQMFRVISKLVAVLVGTASSVQVDF